MRIIDVIEQGIDPYTDYPALLQRAADPQCRVIISNTTEAGIAYTDELVTLDVCPQKLPRQGSGRIKNIASRRSTARWKAVWISSAAS